MAYSHTCIAGEYKSVSDFPHTHFTQSVFYAQVQRHMRRRVVQVIIFDDQAVALSALIVFLPLIGKYTYGYVPYGPTGKKVSQDLARYVQNVCKDLARQENAVFVRLDWNIENDVPKVGFRSLIKTYCGSVFQPRNEWRCMVQQSDELLLSAMHEKHRYSIRTAERREVTAEIVTEGFEKYLDVFYDLMKQNAKRNNFYLHPFSYYQAFFRELPHLPHAALVIARYKEEVLCVYMLLLYMNTMHFVFGASSDHEKNRMPTYLAHYEGMKYARAVGCVYYNFGGIESLADCGEGMKTLTKYKKKYGGEEVAHAPFYDIVCRPFLYALYCLRKYLKR